MGILEGIKTWFALDGVKGFLQEMVRDVSWEDIRPLIQEGKAEWDLVPSDIQEQVRNILSHVPRLKDEVDFQTFVQWAEEVNPDLVRDCFADKLGVEWLRRQYQKLLWWFEEGR